MITTNQTLAINGGARAIAPDTGDLFTWPIVTDEDEAAVLAVLRSRSMSGNELTKIFEREIADWHGAKYALGYCNGTASVLGAMWACGVGPGDEVITASLNYWASALPALSLGARVVFAEIDPKTLCMDPADVRRRITPRTRAIVATHLYGHPCAMDELMAIAASCGAKVIEDVSHAHGALYRGRRLGTIGHVGCMSMMSGKALACGEAGMLLTDDRALWERAAAFGFFERTAASNYNQATDSFSDPELTRFTGVPMGGHKHRMNQTCAAMGRVQLAHYAERMAEIQEAMEYFWQRLAGVPGIRPHRIDPAIGTMGGWYHPVGHYLPEELGGLPVARFCAAVVAEGVAVTVCPNKPLHLHPIFREGRVHGHPAHDAEPVPSLPLSEAASSSRIIAVPWFKHCRKAEISAYADAIRKVAEQVGAVPRAAVGQ